MKTKIMIKTRRSEKKARSNKTVKLLLFSLILMVLFTAFINIAFAQTTRERMLSKRATVPVPLGGTEIALSLLEIFMIVGIIFTKKMKEKKAEKREEEGFFTKLISDLKKKRFKSSNKLLKHIDKLIEEKKKLVERNTDLTTNTGIKGIQGADISWFKSRRHPKSKMISCNKEDKGMVEICIALASINEELIKYIFNATKLSNSEVKILDELKIIVREEERDLLTFFKTHGHKLRDAKLSTDLKDREKAINHLLQVEDESFGKLDELKRILGAKDIHHKDDDVYKNNNEYILIEKENKNASRLVIDSASLKRMSQDECNNVLNIIEGCGDKIKRLFKRERIIFQEIEPLLRYRFEKVLKEETKRFEKDEATLEQLNLSIAEGPLLTLEDENGKFEANNVEEFYHGIMYGKITQDMSSKPNFNTKIVSWLSSFERASAKNLASKLRGKNRDEMEKIIGDEIGEPVSKMVK